MFNTLLQMTWYNPIFMIVTIGIIWFVPGMVLRRFLKRRYESDKAKAQADKIARLYPKEK